MTSPLFVDVYAGDLRGNPNWSLLASLGAPWHGAIVKATESVSYKPVWFAVQWKQLRHVAGERYGVDWFRGAYHFLKFNRPGRDQADFYLKAIEEGGGWDVGDFWPIVDVELGAEGDHLKKIPRNSNQDASAQQIIDCTSAFAERCRSETGRNVMLYGNGAMRDRQIHVRMGCDWIWVPRYTEQLPVGIYARAGWSTAELALWQYSGDGQSALKGYPSSPPGFGACDVSALVLPGGLERLRSLLWAERPA